MNGPYTIHHWDTFDNETFKLATKRTLVEAESYVTKQYEGRIMSDGADQVDIVDAHGNVVRSYHVG